MTYFPDLSPYVYTKQAENGMVNIGFLDADHDFETGSVPFELFVKLTELCEQKFVQHRGLYYCDLCVAPAHVLNNQDVYNAWRSSRASSSLVVIGSSDGKQYVAPSLVLHYISEHQYRPPREFLEAVVGNDLDDYIEYINTRVPRANNPFSWTT